MKAFPYELLYEKHRSVSELTCPGCGSRYRYLGHYMPLYSRLGNMIVNVEGQFELAEETKKEVDLLRGHPDLFFRYNPVFDPRCPYCKTPVDESNAENLETAYVYVIRPKR